MQGTDADRGTARRVRPGGRAALGPGSGVDPVTGERLPEVASLMDVERLVTFLDNRIDVLVDEVNAINEIAANAQADWEEHRDRLFVVLADAGDWKNEKLSEARAKEATSADNIVGHDLYRAHLITTAAAKSADKALKSAESRLSANQSLLKHLREVTGLG